jgi:hypothetical protein
MIALPTRTRRRLDLKTELLLALLPTATVLLVLLQRFTAWALRRFA